MIFIANLMRIHFARATKEIGKVPGTDPASGLVIQSPLNFGLEHAKFLRLLQDIRHGRLPHFFGKKFQGRGGSLGKFAHGFLYNKNFGH
jgi:hypothetical protein